MNEREAVVLAGKLFASQGRVAAAEVVAEYAEMLLEAECGTCAKTTVEHMRRHATANRVPTVPQLWAAYRERYGSAEHGLHYGQDERELAVGQHEGFWRGKGSQVVREIVPGITRDESVYLSLSAWWAEVEPDERQLRSFLESADTWLASTLEHFRGSADKPGSTERIAASCRTRDTTGIESVPYEALP